MFSLNQLLRYDKVVIQCHDNPDPDALASAFAIFRYLEENKVAAEMVYSGFAPISKANLVLMQEAFQLPLRFIEKNAELTLPDEPDNTLLLTVDGQYGAGNVKKLPAYETAIIDHHVREVEEPPLSDIRSFLGSCATLVYTLLKEVNFDFDANIDVATALYYGLYTDTASLSEIIHPLDKDMRDSLRYDTGLIKKLRNSNLTASDLAIASRTLANFQVSDNNRSAVFEADPCDPNILGFIGDLALQVENIDTCIVFCKIGNGVKLSVRSCVREVMANELVMRLCEGVGSGGGHTEKAGGFINADAVAALGYASPMEFLCARFASYFEGYDLIYSNEHTADTSALEKYSKLLLPIGFVKTVDVVPTGTELVIRTLEGDSQVIAHPDIYIMVGVKQEVYPIKREKFEASYNEREEGYTRDKRFFAEDFYAPTVRDKALGQIHDLIPYIRSCIPSGEVSIFAYRLEKRTKVFTSWNLDGYMFGDVGDFLAIRDDDSHDMYVIEKEIFHHTYAKREEHPDVGL